MRFSLPAAVVLFCATTAIAFPQPASNGVITRDDDGSLDLSEVDIDEVEFNADDFDIGGLAARATEHCNNQGRIKRVKPEYKGKCAPANSIGFQSAHNCKSRSGKSYLCVQSNKATCYTINAAVKKNFENGECFTRK